MAALHHPSGFQHWSAVGGRPLLHRICGALEEWDGAGTWAFLTVFSWRCRPTVRWAPVKMLFFPLREVPSSSWWMFVAWRILQLSESSSWRASSKGSTSFPSQVIAASWRPVVACWWPLARSHPANQAACLTVNFQASCPAQGCTRCWGTSHVFILKTARWHRANSLSDLYRWEELTSPWWEGWQFAFPPADSAYWISDPRSIWPLRLAPPAAQCCPPVAVSLNAAAAGCAGGF